MACENVLFKKFLVLRSGFVIVYGYSMYKLIFLKKNLIEYFICLRANHLEMPLFD